MAAPRPTPGCPVCGKPAGATETPFCSRGCRDRDLLQWLGDGYRIPGPPADEDGLDDRLDDRLDRGRTPD